MSAWILVGVAFGACRPAERLADIAPPKEDASGEASGSSPRGESIQVEDSCGVIADDGSYATLGFAWQTRVVRRSPGGVNDLASWKGGVIAVGSESLATSEVQPTVTALDATGGVSWRSTAHPGQRSNLRQPRDVGRAVAARSDGSSFALGTSARMGPVKAYLASLDRNGRQLWSRDLPMSEPADVLPDGNGNALVVGLSSLEGSWLSVAKYDATGAELWARRFAYGSGVPRVAFAPGGQVVLAAGFFGAARLGDAEVVHESRIPVHCAGEAAACPEAEPGRALLVAELAPSGTLTWTRLFSAPDNVIDVSDLTVRADGSLVVTGEFSGPPLRVGSVALCEAEPGLPPAARRPPIEPGPDTDPCKCRRDQRDLYVMALSSTGEPLWARTLGLGHSKPLLEVEPGGDLLWGAHQWREGGEPVLALWRIDSQGEVRGRFATAGAPPRALSVAAGGYVYVAGDDFVSRAMFDP